MQEHNYNPCLYLYCSIIHMKISSERCDSYDRFSIIRMIHMIFLWLLIHMNLRQFPKIQSQKNLYFLVGSTWILMAESSVKIN